VEAIAGDRCNAANPSCTARSAVTLASGEGEGQLAIDAKTRTLYAAGFDSVSVIDTRTCSGSRLTGCAGLTPATIPTGAETFALGVGPRTLYATTIPADSGAGHVEVIDTTDCRAGDTARCADEPRPEVTVGEDPAAAVLDAAHHTLYVTDNAFGVARGELSMVDTAHCNGVDSSACASEAPRTTPMHRAPFRATLDSAAGLLYVVNFGRADVSALGTAGCNAVTTSGCSPNPAETVTGSGPVAAALDPSTHTLYVSNAYGGTLSTVPLPGP
jgi:DNA-binding beta-propeller fold protein YncE